MANESKINFTVSPAEWHANEYLYSYALNGQVNANRNLITAIIDGLNPFYKNANDRDGTISDPASVSTNATLITNALRGILDTTKSGINIDIKSGADITLEAASGKLIEAKSDVKIDQNATFANENPIVTITRNLVLKGTQGTIKIGEYNSEPSEVNNNFDNFDVTTKNRVGLYQRTISGWSNIRTEHAKFVAEINESDVHQGDLHLISNFIIGEKGDDFEDIGLFYSAELDNGYNWHLTHNVYELTAYGKISNSVWYNLELTKDSFEVSGSLNNWKMIASDDDLIVSNTATGNQLYSIVTNIKARVLKEQTYPNGKGIVGNDGGDIYLLNRDLSGNLRYGLHITDGNIYIQRGNNAPETLFGKQQQIYESMISVECAVNNYLGTHDTYRSLIYLKVLTTQQISMSMPAQLFELLIGMYGSVGSPFVSGIINKYDAVAEDSNLLVTYFANACYVDYQRVNDEDVPVIKFRGCEIGVDNNGHIKEGGTPFFNLDAGITVYTIYSKKI